MYKIQIWQGLDGKWYWHIASTRNGQVIATSEGYKKKSGAMKMALKVSKNLITAKVICLDWRWYYACG